MGKRGQAEVGNGARDAVVLPLVDVTDVFLRNEADLARKPGEETTGVSIEEFLERFFLRGVTNQLMRHSVINSLFQQTFSSVVKQLWLGELFSTLTWTRGSNIAVKIKDQDNEAPAPKQARPPRLADKLNGSLRRLRSTPPSSRSKSLSPAMRKQPLDHVEATSSVVKHTSMLHIFYNKKNLVFYEMLTNNS